MDLPDDNSRYKDVDYWDERYKTEQCYDWLGSVSKFKHILEKHVQKADSILILGCGNSSMSGDMYSAGYHSITNIDYSSVCISTMSARHSDCPGMTWHQMDIRQLSFPDASFDVILEKATLDALMVEEKSPWKLSPHTACFLHQALTEISRCLKPGGRFVSVTFAQPFFRKRLCARTEYNWSIKNYSYGEGFEYFVLVMTKGEELSPEDAALEKEMGPEVTTIGRDVGPGEEQGVDPNMACLLDKMPAELQTTVRDQQTVLIVFSKSLLCFQQLFLYAELNCQSEVFHSQTGSAVSKLTC